MVYVYPTAVGGGIYYYSMLFYDIYIVMIDDHLGDNPSLFIFFARSRLRDLVREISCTCTLGYIRGCPAPFIASEPKREHPAHIFIFSSFNQL